MAELQVILSSGDITNYQESATAAGNALQTLDEIKVLVPIITTVADATYTVLATDANKVLHVTRTATGVCTITFPTALISDGFRFVIKDTGGAQTFNITLATEGAETIDGSTTFTINTNYQAINVYCDGTNLFIY